MRNKLIIGISTLIVFFTLSSLAVSQITRKIKDDLYEQIELYSYTLTTVQADYVEEKKAKELIYGSLKGMLSSLDPHSQFLDPDEYKELRTETQGKFGGLGIEISIRDGLLTIITPIEDTPAWKAGIKAGDRIVKIEDEVTKDITLSEAVKKLRGKPNTEVNITILRENPYEILEIKIIREIIHIQDVKHTQILKDNIGYIRLTEFREDSAKEFRKALNKLIELKADSLILDLRNNPGGLLNVAIKITEEFLEEGEVIVSTKARRPSQSTVSYSKNKNHVIDWPMVVLINKGSASGSEILAGALKDNKRAIILGEQSFGKGSIQSVIPMPDGSGLRLTTAKYFTPADISIHGTGITPDIVVERIYPRKDEEKDEDGEEKEKNIKKVFDDVEENEAEDKEKLKLTKLEQEVRDRLLNDNQVQSAMNILNGIKIYKQFNGDGSEPSEDTRDPKDTDQ